ncbi:hypothetical protein ACF07T_40715 [Streptomyces sp. NPDC015184]|uniref:hypothetical protein n=1 Tax=Streptomyces sp. NPDC015184 TaxID=3364946 RepID=UPI0036FF370A
MTPTDTIAALALGVAIIAAVAAIGSWKAARNANGTAQTLSRIEQQRLHADLTPVFRCAIVANEACSTAMLRVHLEGDALYRDQEARADAEDKRRRAAEREARRPVCPQCGTRFTDERWQQTRQSSWPVSGTGCAGRAQRRPPTAWRLSVSRAARRRKPNERPPKHRP